MVDNLQTLKGIYKKKAEQSHLGLFHFTFSLINSLAYPPPQSLQYVQVGQLTKD